MNIYLDIDGVLLDKYGNPADHVDYFLQHVINNFPNTTFWLTTRCQGDASATLMQIGRLFSKETQSLLECIKPTSWTTAKTRAIDFSERFIWLDDNLFLEEKVTLKKFNSLDSFIHIDLRNNPHQLRSIVDVINKITDVAGK